MYRKIAFFLFVSALISTGSFAQVNENIEKQAKDPKTAENAARADVYIIKEKTTLDSMQTKITDKRTDWKKSRKSCWKKRSS